MSPEDGTSELIESVRAALRMVIDPEIGKNIVELGLVYDIREEGEGDVTITMTTTVRGCPAAGLLKESAAACAEAVEGVRQARAILTYDPPWDPDRMASTFF
jgi:metal-sulfur cluster biosynthetic enzyme